MEETTDEGVRVQSAMAETIIFDLMVTTIIPISRYICMENILTNYLQTRSQNIETIVSFDNFQSSLH